MAEVSHPFISVDDHVQEHPSVWLDRLPKSRWGDRVPHLEGNGAGGQWVVDGKPLAGIGVATAEGLLPDRTAPPRSWEDVPLAAYDPRERLKAMDGAGIGYSVLYPTVAGLAGEAFGRLEDPELELACVQAYNDWLIDVWASASPRFIPQCIVPIYPPEMAAAEIRRAVGRGHRGVVYPPLPMELRAVPHVNELEYDVIWATCEALGVPLCLHAGSVPRLQLAPYETLTPPVAGALDRITRPASAIFDVANLLFSQILTRHPGLRVVFAESTLGWAPFMFEVADNQYERDHVYLDPSYPLKPSELFRRQCFFTSWYDRVDDVARYVGADHILWSSGLPLATTTWPDCQDFIERCFSRASEKDTRQILWDNAAGLYGLAPSVANRTP